MSISNCIETFTLCCFDFVFQFGVVGIWVNAVPHVGLECDEIHEHAPMETIASDKLKDIECALDPLAVQEVLNTIYKNLAILYLIYSVIANVETNSASFML